MQRPHLKFRNNNRFKTLGICSLYQNVFEIFVYYLKAVSSFQQFKTPINVFGCIDLFCHYYSFLLTKLLFFWSGSMFFEFCRNSKTLYNNCRSNFAKTDFLYLLNIYTIYICTYYIYTIYTYKKL